MEVFVKIHLLTFFEKAPFWMCEWVLNTSLEGFVQDAPRKKPAIAHAVQCLITTAWEKSH